MTMQSRIKRLTAAQLLDMLLDIDGPGSGLDADLLDGQSSAYYATAAEVAAAALLAKLLTVDGDGSGLDADLLDGEEGAFYRDVDNASAGTLDTDRGGTGVSNPAGSLTFDAATEISGGGEIALDGHTLTVPDDGTAKLLGLTGVHTQAENTAATDVTDALFALATYSGAQLDYVLTRGAGIVRKGTLQIAGDASAPSVSDVAAAVGAAGVTWSAIVASGNVQLQIAVDNSIATGIRLRWELNPWLVP